MKSPILALALGVALAGCSNAASSGEAKADPDAAKTAVREIETNVLNALKAKDADKAASYFADNALVAMPDSTPLVGRAAMAAQLKKDLADPAFVYDFMSQKLEVAKGADMAYSRGGFRLDYTDPKTKRVRTVNGTYVTVFQQQADKSWKIVEDISTTLPAS